GKYELTISDTLMESFVEPREQRRDVVIVRKGENVANAQVPSRAQAIRKLCDDGFLADRHSILLGRVANRDPGRGPLPRGLRVKASWLGDGQIVQTKNLFAAQVHDQSVELDDQRRFSACGVPRAKSVRPVLLRG